MLVVGEDYIMVDSIWSENKENVSAGVCSALLPLEGIMLP